MLSQDPNSLANLDQDLPNNLQHHIPIYSLHKNGFGAILGVLRQRNLKLKLSILCNNPKTFESKIDPS